MRGETWGNPGLASCFGVIGVAGGGYSVGVMTMEVSLSE